MRSGGKTINLADMTKAFHEFVKGFKPKYRITHNRSLGLPTKAVPSPAMVKVLLYELCHRHVTLTPQLVELFNTSVSVNSTAFEHLDPKSGTAIFIGNKTETALLNFVKDLGWAMSWTQSAPSQDTHKKLPSPPDLTLKPSYSQVVKVGEPRHVIMRRDKHGNSPDT